MTRTIRVKTKYLGPTDTKGSRIAVEWMDGRTFAKARRVIDYDYAASDPHEAAVRRSIGTGLPASIEYAGYHPRGHWYNVTLP